MVGACFGNRGRHFGDQRRFELRQGRFAHLRLAQRLADGFERIAAAPGLQVVGAAIEGLVVGIGVVRQALDIHQHDGRTARYAGMGHCRLEGHPGGGEIDAVDAADRQAEIAVGRAGG
jgi:hypothetical protein